MLTSGSRASALAGLIGGAIVSGAALFVVSPPALADPPPPPPNCTAADLAGVATGVSAATSAYLFSHPDVNAFFTGLKGRPKSEIHDDVQQYLDANPQTKADLEGIRQPLVDLKNRCQ